ncbi:hypothetical protein OUZ56_033287 [Daphnia magna]|uniref:Uncharacterized protein n=1 Tax=Daphnia magna TaxID=35525 RepID=A0ABR0BAW2_9CRUS|nr:hypothetical protein OUZ56_033287 [Daphnia magna]
MATDAFTLEAIQEEELEEELEEWQTINDPAELKHYRTQAMRIHMKSLNQTLLAVGCLKIYMQSTYIELAWSVYTTSLKKFTVAKWKSARARSVAGSSRSSTSNRSSALSTRRNLQEAERLEKVMQFKIQQERAEVLQEAEEDERMQQFEIARKAEEERMQQLETARKAEERLVESARKERQL